MRDHFSSRLMCIATCQPAYLRKASIFWTDSMKSRLAASSVAMRKLTAGANLRIPLLGGQKTQKTKIKHVLLWEHGKVAPRSVVGELFLVNLKN